MCQESSRFEGVQRLTQKLTCLIAPRSPLPQKAKAISEPLPRLCRYHQLSSAGVYLKLAYCELGQPAEFSGKHDRHYLHKNLRTIDALVKALRTTLHA